MMPLLIFFLLIAIGIAAFLAWQPLGDGSKYLPDAELVRRLRSISVERDAKGRKIFGSATAELRGGLNVLHLRGSHYEMGYQHGILLSEEVRNGVIPYFARPTGNFAPFKHMNGIARWLLSKHFDWNIYRPLLKNTPAEYLAEIKGVADGSGLSFAEVFKGNMLSDLNMVLIKTLEKKNLSGLRETGCTSFAAFGKATTSGKPIMGRNTDYAGGGLWDTHQTVLFCEPEDGYKFANVSSAGLVKCNSCMNEKGICLGAHFLFLADTRADGISFTFLEIEIMKKAGSIKEAQDILAKARRAGAFAFFVVDGKTNEAAVFELSANHLGVRRPEDGVLWETNMGTTDEIKPVDVFLRNGIGKNPIARFERMRMLMKENTGKITPQTAAGFMGDHMDMCSGSLRPVGGIISQGTNQTSVVFSPSDFNFWVADGLAPVCNNPYKGFNMLTELNDDGSMVEPSVLSPNTYATTDDFKALRKYYEADVKYLIPPTDGKGALDRLEEAVALKPEEAIYRRIAAKIYLRAGEASKAAEHLKKALDSVQSPNELAQTHLLLGFSNDLLGKRDDAIGCYERALKVPTPGDNGVLSAVNPFVIAHARKYSRIPFTLGDAKHVQVSFDIVSMYDL